MFEDLNKKVSLVKEGVMYKVKLASNLDSLTPVNGEAKDGSKYSYLPLELKGTEKDVTIKFNLFDSYWTSTKRNILQQLNVEEDTPLSVMDVLKMIQENSVEVMQVKGNIYFYDRIKQQEESNKVTVEDYAE